MNGSKLFQGLTDQTLTHDQGWHFTQLGKYLERIDVTSRIIDAKFGMLRTADNLLAGRAAEHPLDGRAAELLRAGELPPQARRATWTRCGSRRS
jgi:uncharacterized alpha-E superfamily protein